PAEGLAPAEVVEQGAEDRQARALEAGPAEDLFLEGAARNPAEPSAAVRPSRRLRTAIGPGLTPGSRRAWPVHRATSFALQRKHEGRRGTAPAAFFVSPKTTERS